MNISQLSPDQPQVLNQNVKFFNRELPEFGAERGTDSGYSKIPSDDSVGAFFKEMSRYPLLTPEEEIQLAHHVQFLMQAEELQQQLQEQLQRPPSKTEWAIALDCST